MKLNIKAKTVLLLLTLCFFSALISSCGLATLTTTEHVFVMHTATDPTCTECGNYVYYTCAHCDKIFNFNKYVVDEIPQIEPLGHQYGTSYHSDEVSHWRECIRCGDQEQAQSHVGEASCMHQAQCTVCGSDFGGLGTHVYNNQVATDEYLKCSATCTSKAVYYYSCQCGQKSDTTFEYGEVLGHAISSEWSADGEYHWHACTRQGCNYTQDKSTHGGGNATCMHQAQCTVCGSDFGDLGAHDVLSLTVSKAPDKVIYNSNEVFAQIGMEVVFTCGNQGCCGGVTTDYTIKYQTNKSCISAGDNKVTVCYGGKIADVAIACDIPSTLSQAYVRRGAELSLTDLGVNPLLTVDSVTCDMLGTVNLLNAQRKLNVSLLDTVGLGVKSRLVVHTQINGIDTQITVPCLFVTDTLSTFEDLSKIKYVGNGSNASDDIDGYYVLTNDIDCQGKTISGGKFNGWSPSRGFVGTFDGQGFAISNFSVGTGGVFGSLGNGAVVKNVDFDNVALLNQSYTATLAYIICNATVNNVNLILTSVPSNAQSGVFGAGCETSPKYYNVTVYAQGLDIKYFAGYNCQNSPSAPYLAQYENTVVYAKSVTGYGTEFNNATNVFPLSVVKHGLNVVLDGQAEDDLYKIVSDANLPPKAIDLLNEALQDCFGNKVERTITSELVDLSSGKYVVVGNQTVAEHYGINLPDGKDYLVKSVDDDVVIIANSQSAYHNAIVKFLQKVLGRVTYSADLTVYNDLSDTTTAFDDVEISGNVYFENVQESNTVSNGTSTDFFTTYQMGFAGSYLFVPVNGNFFHTSFKILPKETYLATHPNWYSNDSGHAQLCYTAHGNSAELEAMVSQTVETLIYWIDKSTSNVVTISMEDSPLACTCNACKQSVQRYGSVSASVIKFANAVDKKLQEHYSLQDRKIQVYILAYASLMTAPTQHIDEVQCNSNVGVIYAPIRAIYDKPLNDSSNVIAPGDSRTYYDALAEWANVTKNISYWLYETNFTMYLYPLANWYAMVQNYRLIADFNVSNGINSFYMFSQGQTVPKQQGYTSFTALKLFIDARASADPYGGTTCEDYYEALLDEFFATYYGEGGAKMRQLFDLTVQKVQKLRNKYCTHPSIAYNEFDTADGVNGISGDNHLAKSIYWPKTELLSYKQLCDEALALLDTNNENYQSYRKHIIAESVFSRFALLQIYGYTTEGLYGSATISPDRILKESSKNEAQQLYNDMIYCGIYHYTEFVNIDSLGWNKN